VSIGHFGRRSEVFGHFGPKSTRDFGPKVQHEIGDARVKGRQGEALITGS